MEPSDLDVGSDGACIPHRRGHEGTVVDDELSALRDELQRERRRADVTRGTFDAFPQITWMSRPDGSVEFFNARWVEYTGLPRTPAGAEWASAIHPDDREVLNRTREAMIARGVPYQVDARIRGGDGTFRWHQCTVVPTRDEQGAITSWVGTASDVHALRENERALRESRERLSAALAASETGTFRWDLNDHSLEWDDSLDRLFGLEPGRTARSLSAFIELVHPDDRAGVAERCQRCIEQGADFVMEFRVVWPDGSVHWLDDRGKTFRGPDGRPAYMTGACVDVTARKRLEESLRHFADAMPQIVWVNDPSGRVEHFNRRWAEYTGVAVNLSLGDAYRSRIHPDDLPAATVKWQAHLASGQPFENEHRICNAAGQYRWHLVRAVPVRDGGDGAIVRWFGTCTDVHVRKLALDELRAKQQLLEFTHEVARVGSFEWNIRDNVNTWSPQLEELYGLPPGSFAGRLQSWEQCVHPDDLARASADLQRSLQIGSFVTDFRIVRPGDGEVRWLNARAKVLFDDQGRPDRMIGINLDVTERKAAEEALGAAREEAERANRTKDEFLAALSHELRTPLSPVLLMTQLWERDPDIPEQLRKDLAVVRRNVEIETRLIDDLLDLTRVARGKLQLLPQPLDLHALLVEAAETCRDDLFAQKRLALTFELAANEHWVSGDPARLGQVVWNLVKNATKFTPAGGRISIGTESVAAGRVAIVVSDTGVGIEADMLPKVFNAFEQGGAHVTRRFGGLGLGLAICKAVVELHGGRIEARSDGRGRGARFIVELPAIDRPSATIKPFDASGAATETKGDARVSVRDGRIASAADAGGGRTILLVEDHESTGRAMRRLLSGLGYDVHWAESARAAMEAAADRPFDLVVSDLGLPDASGHELMRDLRQAYGLRGVALSGYGMEDDLQRSAEAGFVQHLVKPISIDKLRAVLAEILS